MALSAWGLGVEVTLALTPASPTSRERRAWVLSLWEQGPGGEGGRSVLRAGAAQQGEGARHDVFDREAVARQQL